MAIAHTPITIGITNAAISVAKYNNDRHQTWHDAQVSFKSALIRSLGLTLEGAIGPPPEGFKTISARAIMDEVKARYGKVDQVTFARMEDVLSTPLDHIHNLDKHLASQKRHMLMQTSAGYPLEEYRKVRIFRKSVTMHHQIRECLGDYDKLHSDPLLQTYAAVTSYVQIHLPNIRAAAEMSSSSTTGKAFHASAFPSASQSSSTHSLPTSAHTMSMTELMCAYSVLEYKHKALQDRNKRPAKGKGGDGKRHKGDRTGETKALDPNAPCKFYCYAHGSQNSHSSNQCKVMAGQKQHFTAAMRSAMSPSSPGGGSTLVRGKNGHAPTKATAYMMSAVPEGTDSTESTQGTQPSTKCSYSYT